MQPIAKTLRPVWGLMDKCYPVTTQVGKGWGGEVRLLSWLLLAGTARRTAPGKDGQWLIDMCNLFCLLQRRKLKSGKKQVSRLRKTPLERPAMAPFLRECDWTQGYPAHGASSRSNHGPCWGETCQFTKNCSAKKGPSQEKQRLEHPQMCTQEEGWGFWGPCCVWFFLFTLPAGRGLQGHGRTEWRCLKRGHWHLVSGGRAGEVPLGGCNQLHSYWGGGGRDPMLGGKGRSGASTGTSPA
jgi:hypothetical protein